MNNDHRGTTANMRALWRRRLQGRRTFQAVQRRHSLSSQRWRRSALTVGPFPLCTCVFGVAGVTDGVLLHRAGPGRATPPRAAVHCRADGLPED